METYTNDVGLERTMNCFEGSPNLNLPTYLLEAAKQHLIK